MLTGRQLAALSELLHTCRPDWETRGIQAALRRLDDTWTWPAICIHAITAAANTRNHTPDTIAWHNPAADLEQFAPCPTHGGKTRRPDGTYACCWAEGAEPRPFLRANVTRPPADFRAQVEAAKTTARRPDPTPAGIGAHDRHWTAERREQVTAELTAARERSPVEQPTRQPAQPEETR